MSEVQLQVTDIQETETQYVCFLKRRTGAPYFPYTMPESDVVVVKSLREFLNHEIIRWIDPSVFMKFTLEQFVNDVSDEPVNAKLAAMLGWNYAEAARLVEKEQAVFVLMVHPRFQAIPYSFRRVKEDDEYALALVKKIWSLRGGDIVFEQYDPERHVPGCAYEG
jgi:hypothetical protein